jgi:hypothetical protein
MMTGIKRTWRCTLPAGGSPIECSRRSNYERGLAMEFGGSTHRQDKASFGSDVRHIHGCNAARASGRY